MNESDARLMGAVILSSVGFIWSEQEKRQRSLAPIAL